MTQYPINIQGKCISILNPDEEYDTDQDIVCATTSVARSEKFFMLKGHSFGWEVQFESDGVINATIELEQQFEDGDDWVVPDNHSDDPMFTITDSSTHQVAYAPIASLYGRLKITGVGSNDVTTTLTKAKMYVARNYG